MMIRPTHCDHCSQRLPETGPMYQSDWSGEDLCRACAEREQDTPSHNECQRCFGDGIKDEYVCHECHGTGIELDS